MTEVFVESDDQPLHNYLFHNHMLHNYLLHNYLLYNNLLYNNLLHNLTSTSLLYLGFQNSGIPRTNSPACRDRVQRQVVAVSFLDPRDITLSYMKRTMCFRHDRHSLAEYTTVEQGKKEK